VSGSRSGALTCCRNGRFLLVAFSLSVSEQIDPRPACPFWPLSATDCFLRSFILPLRFLRHFPVLSCLQTYLARSPCRLRSDPAAIFGSIFNLLFSPLTYTSVCLALFGLSVSARSNCCGSLAPFQILLQSPFLFTTSVDYPVTSIFTPIRIASFGITPFDFLV